MDIAQLYQDRFHSIPEVSVRAPGRVNLIGEHIDYNGGHVLPLAIGLGVRLAARRREDGVFRFYSAQYDTLYEGPRRSEKAEEDFWANYLFGVIDEFDKAGHSLPGMDAVLWGDIPQGSGLSSSAALEVATAWALQEMLGTELPRIEIAQLCQRAENRFVGVNCGIMDQAISACGKAGHALLLDCDSLAHEQAPLELGQEARVLVAHSGVHRGLSGSEYNRRRGSCDAALEILRRESDRELPCLCAATADLLEAARNALSDEHYRRARHAISEQGRVNEAVKALGARDFPAVGELLNASHASLAGDYEVSCEELDTLTEMIRNEDGAWGSRLTGAGFGGCTVSLVAADAADAILEKIRRDYYEPRGFEPICFPTQAHEGVQQL